MIVCNNYMSVCTHTVSHPPNPFLIKMVMNFFALCWRKETRARQKKKWLFEGWKYSQIILFFAQWPSWGLQENSHLQSPIFLDWLATSYLGNAGSDLEESQKTKKPRKGDLMQCGTGLPCLMTFRVGKICFLQQNISMRGTCTSYMGPSVTLHWGGLTITFVFTMNTFISILPFVRT